MGLLSGEHSCINAVLNRAGRFFLGVGKNMPNAAVLVFHGLETSVPSLFHGLETEIPCLFHGVDVSFILVSLCRFKFHASLMV